MLRHTRKKHEGDHIEKLVRDIKETRSWSLGDNGSMAYDVHLHSRNCLCMEKTVHLQPQTLHVALGNWQGRLKSHVETRLEGQKSPNTERDFIFLHGSPH